MRVILNELKKIFNIKTTLLLIALGLIIFEMFSAFELEHFPNGEPNTQSLRITKEMKNRYGETINEKEAREFKIEYKKELLKNADEYLKNNKEAQRLGVTSYEELRRIVEEAPKDKMDEQYNEKEKLYDKIIFEEQSDEFWSLSAFSSIEERLDLVKDEEDIVHEQIVQSYKYYTNGLFKMIIVLTMGFLGTIFIKDRNSRVDYIQYTSKKGRRINKSKVIAGIIASIIITTIIVGITIPLYFVINDTTMFFNSKINGVFMFSKWSSFNGTFLQYIILSIITLYIIGIVTAIITMIISKMSDTYMKAISIGVVILVILNLGYGFVMERVLLFESEIFLGATFIIPLIVSSVILILKIRENKKDILY